MNERLRYGLVIASCAAMTMALTSCGDDSAGGGSGEQTVQCGDSTCTSEQICDTEQMKCVDKPAADPCDSCTAEQVCENGSCVDKPVEDPCMSCTSDQICDNGSCVDKPVEDPCASCTEEQICDPTTGTCMEPPEDPCSKCLENQECINLECVDIDPCANKTCPDQQRCDSAQGGICVDIDPCEGVICGEAQTCIQAQCIDDACIENGVEKTCDAGKVCSKGECVDDGCQDVVCDEGWQCIKGICEETVCLNYFCEEGRSCRGGKCVDNECLDMTCAEGQICSKGNCTYEACLDKEPCTTGKVCNAEGACVFVNPPAISLDEPEDKTTDEASKSIALALRLNNLPTAEVRVTCEAVSESPNTEIEAACEEIVFNADNWQLEQTIVVTGVDDYLKDGDQTYKLKVTTVSEDVDFNGLTVESVELTNLDMTKAGFIFSETSLTTYEDQSVEPSVFTIRLSSIPEEDVSLSMSSSNEAEGIVSPLRVVFTKDNWNQPQTISVKGQDDESNDRNVNYTVFFSPSASDDPDYNELHPSSIKVTNIDNDVAGLNVNIPAEDYSIIEGQDAMIFVKLNTLPKKEVRVAIEIDNKEELVSDVEEVVLNAENWKEGVSVRLTGVQEYIIDGDKPVKISFTASSEDTDYNLEPVVFNATVKDADTGDIVTSLGDAPVVLEGNATFVTLGVALASKPTQTVNIELSVTDSTELKINKKTLSFKPDYWDMLQDILVNSLDDDIVDGDIKSKVVMTMTSADVHFNGTKEVEFMTVDNDEAGFTIQSNSASFPEDSASTMSMKVALKSQPTADVQVAVSSTDATELTVASGSSLTFTPTNWKTPQSISAKVVDDKLADGTQTAQIKFTASSTDANFNGINGYSALYTITDNDAPSIVLTADSTTLPQASPNTVASVALGIEPTAEVTVSLISDHASVTFEPSTLRFNGSNWNQAQNVNVNADFSSIAAASATANISAKATAGTGYVNVVSNTIPLNLIKVPEVQNFTYTGNVQNVNLPKGKYKLEVWGAQGGGNGGKGGYSVGTITLPNSTQMYIYVGGQGTNNISTGAGWNGGGYPTNESYYGGGGGTDIRLLSDSLYSRVIVAGGGGGTRSGFTPGGGGGLTSFQGSPTSDYCAATVATISSAGISIANGGKSSWGQYVTDGAFGEGGSWISSAGTVNGFAGGGGGWYGGGAGHVATGGSGWVYTATNYTNWKSNNATDANKYTLSSVYYLTNAQTTAGNASVPAISGGTETGHSGHGHARITLVK